MDKLKEEVARLTDQVAKTEAVLETMKTKYRHKKEELDNLAHQFAMFKAARAEVIV